MDAIQCVDFLYGVDMKMRPLIPAISLSLGLALTAFGASAAPATPARPLEWVTLGTNAGPYIHQNRSEPANLLVVNGKPWLVDCGDGAMERLAAAGFQAADVSVVFISHLHMDHIGGIQGLIGLRWMTSATTPMTIYGPPGTQELVNGILKSLAPTIKIGQFEPMRGMPPDKMVKVVTVEGGADLQVDGVRVRTVRNSHFDMPPGHHLPDGTQSLGYRFDVDGQSITFTGDTGPSDAMTGLAKGTDILVSEVIDKDGMEQQALADKKRPVAAMKAEVEHFGTQHLSPQDAGAMAAKAGAKQLVYTHIATVFGATPPNGDAIEREAIARIVAETKQVYNGKVAVSNDLDRYSVAATR
ncbi:MBL fold metallo-hydrolase [Paraburkholderia silviterrae]|uniref:MBL fold metallo-hydrolase n=1 Tax=Paraburkholderia silviterrae TaxID=2528715 RepID=UPI00196BAE9D|nr:MBL fold metallo-hydrolase [Paraburkholderia silviterrae]